MNEPFGMLAKDGVMRFPAPVAEMIFHLTSSIILYGLWRYKLFAGRLFALYLGGYGVFRFTSEFWRETEKAFLGWSAYQWIALMMVAASVLVVLLRARMAVDSSGRSIGS